MIYLRIAMMGLTIGASVQAGSFLFVQAVNGAFNVGERLAPVVRKKRKAFKKKRKALKKDIGAKVDNLKARGKKLWKRS